MQIIRIIAVGIVALVGTPAAAEPVPQDMALLPGGSYKPLYSKAEQERVAGPCFMDVTQVTNAQFLNFVKAHPEWQRSKVKRSQADANYLRHWAGDLDPGTGAASLPDAPVTHVSWFAAKAYCEAQGKRLPTQDEWEFAARADATRPDATNDPAFVRQLLEWYSKPATGSLAAVQSAAPNVYGLRGLHGLVWEWVQDFNSSMIVGDSRGDASLERSMFCGAGSLLAADVSNYAAYMRYAFRSSLKGDYCVGSLGFRAAKSLHPSPAEGTSSVVFTTPYELPGKWRNQDGKPVTLGSLRGKVTVLTMGFTRCKSACPRTMSDMQRMEQALGAEADRVAFVFLSIDPSNDTPGQMTRVMIERKMDPARWSFLTASEDVVRETAVALNFKYQMVDGLFAHSNLIAVLDEDGRTVHRTEALGADILPSLDAVRRLLPKR